MLIISLINMTLSTFDIISKTPLRKSRQTTNRRNIPYKRRTDSYYYSRISEKHLISRDDSDLIPRISAYPLFGVFLEFTLNEEQTDLNLF